MNLEYSSKEIHPMRRKDELEKEWPVVYAHFQAEIAKLRHYTQRLNADSPELNLYIDTVTAALGFANLLRDNSAFVKTPGTRQLMKTLTVIIVENTIIGGEISTSSIRKEKLRLESINPIIINGLFSQIEMAFEDDNKIKKGVSKEIKHVKSKAIGA